MHEQPPRRRAALARRPDRSKDNRPYCQVEVCTVIHDDGVIPASSSSVRPSRCPTMRGHVAADGTDPVKEINGNRGSPNHGFRKRRLIGDEQRKNAANTLAAP